MDEVGLSTIEQLNAMMQSVAFPRNPPTSPCMHQQAPIRSLESSPHPRSPASPSFPHPRTEIVVLPRAMSRIAHRRVEGRFHEDRSLSPNRRRQNCSFRVSPGTATGIFWKLPSNSLPGYRRQRWTCSTGGGPGVETLASLDSRD